LPTFLGRELQPNAYQMAEKTPTRKEFPKKWLKNFPTIEEQIASGYDDAHFWVEYYNALIEEEREAKWKAEFEWRAQHEGLTKRVGESQPKKLGLTFTKTELKHFVLQRKEKLAAKSQDWIDRASKALWKCTKGELSRDSMTALRQNVLHKYSSADSHSKVLNFATAFLKFLATTRSEPKFNSITPYLELPRTVKDRKHITERIVTKEDIENVLRYIKNAEQSGKIDSKRAAQYTAIITFGAYTGQRVVSTIKTLTVGQFRKALGMEKPVVQVKTSQDKIRMEHYVPLHPQAVKAIEAVIGDREDQASMFNYGSFEMWLKRQKIPMSRFDGHFVLSDLRKFAEQYGDVIQWESSNRAYILTHGVSGVDWRHYKHPLPESVYDVYMKYWKNVSLDI